MPTYSASFGGRAGRAKGKTPKKKKSKIKCPLCGKNGHEEADCPRAQADSEDAEGVGARGGEAAKGGAGSGITHKTSRRAKGSGKDGSAAPKLALPLGFTAAGDAGALSTLSSISEAGGGGGGGEGGSSLPYLFFDAGCDVGATLDHLTTMPSTRKKSKGSTPTTLYQQSMASSASNYGGAICRQYLKPNRAWSQQTARTDLIRAAEPHVWFVLGLGPGFTCGAEDGGGSSNGDGDVNEGSDDDDECRQEAIDALLDAIAADEDVVGFFANLDYTPGMLSRPGQDRESQLRRFRATCIAAMQENVPIQCRILPSADGGGGGGGGGEDDGESDGESAYDLAFKDLVKALAEMRSKTKTPPSQSDEGSGGAAADSDSDGGGVDGAGAGVCGSGSLRIHLGCWAGKSDHMLLLLKAFPDTLYVGMNGSVGFAKSTIAAECAFDVPLNRLLLETDAPQATPAPVVSALGRAAYCHPGLVPFVAAAVSEHKKAAEATAVAVARAAAENTAALYGRGVAVRAAEAAAQAAAEAAAVAAAAAKAAEEDAAAAEAAAAERAEAEAAAAERLKAAEESGEGMGGKKKKKKKKKNRDNNNGDGDGAGGGGGEGGGEAGGGGGGGVGYRDGNPDDDFDKSYFAGGEIDVGGGDGADEFHEL